MLRPRFLPTLFSIGLLAAVACSDSTAPKTQSTARTQPEQAFVTLSGTIHLSDVKSYPAVLSTSDGQDIPLAGESANMLVSVANAGVDVRGEWLADGIFEVSDFLVRTVDGGAVIDGVLVALYTNPIELTDPAGYAIRPTDGGAWIKLTDPPADFLTHVNERVWVAGVEDGGGPTAFGVITKM